MSISKNATPCTLMLNGDNRKNYARVKERLETYQATPLNHQQTLMLLCKIVNTFLDKEYRE